MNELEIKGLKEMIKEEVEEQLSERIDELKGDIDADEEEEEVSGEPLPPETEEEETEDEADQGGEDGEEVADAPKITKPGQRVSKKEIEALNKPKTSPKLVPTSIKEEEKWEDEFRE